jgi:hypothetical protein
MRNQISPEQDGQKRLVELLRESAYWVISLASLVLPLNPVVGKWFVKKQQMQWTPRGAHLLLQTRTKVLNDDLEDVFRGRYPQFHARAA